MNEYLKVLRTSPEFQLVLKTLLENRPAVPEYDYQGDNTKEWQALSNKRQGYDLALTFLGEDL